MNAGSVINKNKIKTISYQQKRLHSMIIAALNEPLHTVFDVNILTKNQRTVNRAERRSLNDHTSKEVIVTSIRVKRTIHCTTDTFA